MRIGWQVRDAGLNDEHAQERKSGENPERLPLGELRPDDRGQDEVLEALEESAGLGAASRSSLVRGRGSFEVRLNPCTPQLPSVLPNLRSRMTKS